MLVRRFLGRLSKSEPRERAEIVQALVRVYLEAGLDDENRRHATTALTTILDNPAPRVRRAMSSWRLPRTRPTLRQSYSKPLPS